MPLVLLLAFLLVAAFPEGSAAVTEHHKTKPVQALPEWVARSNRNAVLLLDVIVRFNPESAGRLGVEGHDEEIVDLRPGYQERSAAAYREAAAELERRLAAETDPAVRLDLEILATTARRGARGIELSRQYLVPYWAMGSEIYEGLRGLLDDQVAPERRSAALVRLRRYAGLEPGCEPVTALAERHIREGLLRPGLTLPFRVEVGKDLAKSRFFIEGIGKLFARYRIAGYEEPLARLTEELVEYENFIRTEILPRARDDFRLPAEIYAFRLEDFGLDIAPDRLIASAREGYASILAEMESMAPALAKKMGLLPGAGYRDVIRALRADQIPPGKVLATYRERAAEIEAIIREHRIVTVPKRPMRIRLATEAESAAVAAPYMRPPPLIGNRGEQGEFVLPLAVPSEDGGKERLPDFSFETISWMLTAHEGRPGHELQFAAMVDQGVSLARAVFAFNSVNAEGWALYAETLIQPYMPEEGRFMALQFRLLRAARAFLDPELQLGRISADEARRILVDDVVISPAFAGEELDRYRFFLPGQAPSYFHGWKLLMELRRETERALGESFSLLAFHDFILAQGLLPPALLRRAVLQEFVPSILNSRSAKKGLPPASASGT